MVTKRKSTTRRRKPGAKAPGRKRKARVKGLPRRDVTTQNAGSFISVSGVGRFKKSTCHKTKTDAKKAAAAKRSGGALARVRKNAKGGYCVFTRGRARAK